jgi:hypothetical protein
LAVAGGGERVLPPGAEAIVKRALERAAPRLRLFSANIEADHAVLIVCAEEKCYGVRLDDPEKGCSEPPAGPFCLHFYEPLMPAEHRDALSRAFAAEDPRAAWVPIGESPPSGSTEGTEPHPRRRAPRPAITMLALCGAPIGLGLLLGALARRVLGQPLTSTAAAVAAVVVPTAAGALATLGQMRVGIYDLMLAGALLGLGFLVVAYRALAGQNAKRLGFACGSLAIALLAGEVVVRRVAPPPPPINAEEAHRLFLDPHEADLAFTRFDRWGDAAPLNAALQAALYPDAGARFYAERGATAAAASRRVLHLGDSMVFGLGVERAEAFPALLEALEPGVAHVNSGLPSLAPDAHWMLLHRWLARVPFDVVVLHFFTGNDVKEMDSSYPFCGDGPLLDYDSVPPSERCPAPIGARFAHGRLAWMLQHSPPPFVLREAAGRSAVAAHATAAFIALRGRALHSRPPEQEAWAHIEAILTGFRDELAARRVRLVVDVLPLRDALEAFDPTLTEAYAARARMIEIAQRLGVEVLDPWSDLQEAVKRDGSEHWFATAIPHDLHFGPEGHAFMARWLHAHARLHLDLP